jgi:hypothetical protein
MKQVHFSLPPPGGMGMSLMITVSAFTVNEQMSSIRTKIVIFVMITRIRSKIFLCPLIPPIYAR